MNDLKAIAISDDIEIQAPTAAKALVEEIWGGNCYLRHTEIHAGDIVVDIGANVGIFSLLAASKGAIVYSFEPNPESFSLLERNIISNGFHDRIKPFNFAISSADGYIELAVPDTEKIYALGSATTTKATRLQLEQDKGIPSRIFSVPCISIRTMVDEIIGHGKEVHLMKVDCEGAEWDIVESLKPQLASRIKNIAMETHVGYRERDFIGLLKTLGFRICEVQQRGGPFLTGYVYGSYSAQIPSNEVPPGPVSIFESNPFIISGEAASFNAENSFVSSRTLAA